MACTGLCDNDDDDTNFSAPMAIPESDSERRLSLEISTLATEAGKLADAASLLADQSDAVVEELDLSTKGCLLTTDWVCDEDPVAVLSSVTSSGLESVLVPPPTPDHTPDARHVPVCVNVPVCPL